MYVCMYACPLPAEAHDTELVNGRKAEPAAGCRSRLAVQRTCAPTATRTHDLRTSQARRSPTAGRSDAQEQTLAACPIVTTPRPRSVVTRQIGITRGTRSAGQPGGGSVRENATSSAQNRR
jgi:hypothetical protein